MSDVQDTPTAARYTLTVYLTAPCEDGVTAYTPQSLERAVIHHLRMLDGAVDCELMDTEWLTEATS